MTFCTWLSNFKYFIGIGTKTDPFWFRSYSKPKLHYWYTPIMVHQFQYFLNRSNFSYPQLTPNMVILFHKQLKIRSRQIAQY